MAVQEVEPTRQVGASRLTVAGKGGSGKSVVAATVARFFARRGHDVLAIDADPVPGLTLALGMPDDLRLPLARIVEKDAGTMLGWRLPSGMTPARVVEWCSAEGPDGMRVMQLAKAIPGRSTEEFRASFAAYFHFLHQLAKPGALDRWFVVRDVPAGTRACGPNWSPYRGIFLIVVEPTMQSILAARRIREVALMRDGVHVLFVANKMVDRADSKLIANELGCVPFAAVPLDPDVHEAARVGASLLDTCPNSVAVREIDRLTDYLVEKGAG